MTKLLMKNSRRKELQETYYSLTKFVLSCINLLQQGRIHKRDHGMPQKGESERALLKGRNSAKPF